MPVTINGNGAISGLVIATGDLADGAVTLPKMANVATATVLGRSTAGTGVPEAMTTLPAVSGVNLTALNASNLGSGTVPTARLASGTANSTTYLRGDQTWATLSNSYVGARGQVFTGNGTYTIPTGVTAVKVTVVGGGGGGGNATYVCAHGSGGGGGGGGTAIKYLTSLTPGNTLSVTVGGGGGATATGGTSSVSSGSQSISTISGVGGSGGASGAGGSGNGGSGGSSSGGDMNSAGGGGDVGQGQSQTAQGGASMFGGGGRGTQGSTGGEAGRAYGGGGSGGCSIGGTNGTGGAGAAGVVIFEW